MGYKCLFETELIFAGEEEQANGVLMVREK